MRRLPVLLVLALCLGAVSEPMAGSVPSQVSVRPVRLNDVRDAWGHRGVSVCYDTLTTDEGAGLFMPQWRPSGSAAYRNFEGIYASVEVVSGDVWVRHIGPMYLTGSDSSRVVRLGAETNFFQSWRAPTWAVRVWAVTGEAIVAVTLF